MNRGIVILFLILTEICCAQMIEAYSKPYRFNVDKMMYIEGISSKNEFNIQPYKNLIRQSLDSAIGNWYQKEGYQIAQNPNFEKILIEKLETIQPEVINSVGITALSHTKPDVFFVPEKFSFEFSFYGFEPIFIEIPISEIEPFKRGIDKISFSHQNITYNSSDRFVITELMIHNPETNSDYSFVLSSSELIPSPSFTVSLPELDL